MRVGQVASRRSTVFATCGRRLVGRQQEAAPAAAHRDRLGADALEEPRLEVRREPLLGRRVEDERRDLRGREAVVEPGLAEIRDRGDVDQHLRQHHEQDGQAEEPRRQAEPAREPSGQRERRPGVHLRSPEAPRDPDQPAQPAGSARTGAGTRPRRASSPPTGSGTGRRGRRGPATLSPFWHGERPGHDELARLRARDGAAEDPPARGHDRLDVARDRPLRLGAVVLREGPAQDPDRPVPGARLLLRQADRGELGIREGDPRDRAAIDPRPGSRNSALRTTRPAW